MAKVDDIKKNVLMENDVFTGWTRELEMFEETYLYARELAEQMLEKSGAEAFEDFSNGIFSRGDLPKTVNTYPFGKKTKNVCLTYMWMKRIVTRLIMKSIMRTMNCPKSKDSVMRWN